MPFPRVMWQGQECDEEGRRAVTSAEAKQSRAEQVWEETAGDHMVIGGVTSMKPWGRLEPSTSTQAGAC